jgi:hypothetical protein
MALSDVSNILWRERQFLELLVIKLEEEQLTPAAGRERRVAYATLEVEHLLDEIKLVALERSILVADAGREVGLSGSPTLRELSGRTSSPWGGIFAEHRRALLTLQATLSGQTTRAENQPAPGCPEFLRAQTLQGQSTSAGLTMRQNPSGIEDADIARAIPPSLTDFLK